MWEDDGGEGSEGNEGCSQGEEKDEVSATEQHWPEDPGRRGLLIIRDAMVCSLARKGTEKQTTKMVGKDMEGKPFSNYL